jgi:hypothetical protein
VQTIYDDHNSLLAEIKTLSTPKPPCPVCDSSKNPPIQVINPPPPPSKDSPFPCDYAMRFSQTESSNSLGPDPFEERVEFIPKKFETKGDTHITPIVLFYMNARIASGTAQGVMKDEYTGDPLAAGINLSVGRGGIILRHPEVAELWIDDQDKFVKAKKVVVDFFGPERFKVVCVKQLVVTNRYITVPNATAPK